MRESRFVLVEHANLIRKQRENNVKLRVALLGNQGHIFFASNSLYLCSINNITLLLTGTIEPAKEKTGALSLLIIVSTAHIEQDIWIDTEEFLNNTNQGLWNLLVSRRSLMGHIAQVQPISREIGVGIVIKIHSILYAIVSGEDKVIFVIGYMIRRMVINSVGVKPIHSLYPFQIIITRFCSLLFATLALRVFGINFLLPFLFALTGSIEPGKKLCMSPLRYWCCIVHNPQLVGLRLQN